MSDRTLVLLKPDAVERKLTGEIISRFEAKNLSIVAMELRSLDAAITKLLARDDVSLDVTSRAHLAELQSRIGKVLAADLVLPRP